MHLADAILWGVAILSAALPWLSVYGISVKRDRGFQSQSSLPGPVEGQSLEIDLHLVNRWWIPRFLLNLSYAIESPQSKSEESLV
ncbi:MAG: hypothetical protein O3B95_12760, partial [Chloroflexi bacterium]|nr:hypothetical protein [Chloroflexota bacterium]